MVAKGTTAGMAADNRLLTDVQGIIEALLGGMTQVHHDTQAVHLANHLPTKLAQPVMGVAPTGRIANVIVAIVAQRHIDDAALCKVVEILKLSVERQAVFYT